MGRSSFQGDSGLRNKFGGSLKSMRPSKREEQEEDEQRKNRREFPDTDVGSEDHTIRSVS